MNMQDLERFASDARMIPNAPIEASRTIAIDAPIDRVWDVLTDVPKWPTWYAYLRNAALAGPFGAGAKLSYGGLVKHHLAIARVERPELVMLYGKLMHFSAVTKWELQEMSPTRTSVTFTESSEGFLIAALYSNAKLAAHLGRWLKQLKRQAERQ